ncbi:MAG: ferredoxin--NADP reductase [Chloroflexota bacterium]|jgi:ferredoxin--NADP+ reductase|uniref:ferredoxin--NADP(+) reductase n=1 Tax=Candidatus Nitricoxidivorans perseverans TaxID=2975601 RepID=A0AA49FLA0_9PROT|nr:MAG: ferredoxin--NADP reductase [Candidatus Nitricoxidivorans perseverans]
MHSAQTYRRAVPHDPLEKATAERILSIRRWTEKLFSVRVSRSPTFRFTPGQWVRLGITSGSGLPGSIIWRPYSMANAAHDEYLEFFSILVPGGAFSSRLATAQIGDTLYVEKQVYGFLTTSRFVGGRHLWMMASGTGLAPFVSILQDPEVWQRYDERVLAYSARETRELAYVDELAALGQQEWLGAGRKPLRFVPVVTRENRPGVLHQRLPKLITSGGLEETAGLQLSAEDSRILVCGNPQMLDDVRDALVERGLRMDRSKTPGNFATENYW